MGVLFGVLYWMTGSVWAPMLLHIVVDLNSGWLNWQIVREDALDDPAKPAAASLFEQELGGSQ
ncbi:MAG: type II CAAX prenyl endopeptidase Rce1 family protein [Acidimicrobiia bacterium]